jgi:hypothetical protein
MLAALRVKEKVIATVSSRQSTNGAQPEPDSENMLNCTRYCAEKRPHGITFGMAGGDACPSPRFRGPLLEPGMTKWRLVFP